jgi:hypothetical protein
MSISVINCLVQAEDYPISGKLHMNRRSIFHMVVFPNIISWPALSSRDLS